MADRGVCISALKIQQLIDTGQQAAYQIDTTLASLVGNIVQSSGLDHDQSWLQISDLEDFLLHKDNILKACIRAVGFLASVAAAKTTLGDVRKEPCIVCIWRMMGTPNHLFEPCRDVAGKYTDNRCSFCYTTQKLCVAPNFAPGKRGHKMMRLLMLRHRVSAPRVSLS